MATRFDFLMRPRRSLLRTAWIALIVGSMPVFGVLYWQAARWGGSFDIVLHVHLVVIILGLLTYWRQKSVFTGITGGKLVGNGIFSPSISVPLDEILHAELVKVDSRDPGEPTVQFVAVDAAGRARFRMRGPYWHLDDLRALADRLGGAVEPKETLAPEEFFTKYPGSAYWFERHPALRVGLAGLGVIGAVLGATALVAAAGMPTFLG